MIRLISSFPNDRTMHMKCNNIGPSRLRHAMRMISQLAADMEVWTHVKNDKL